MCRLRKPAYASRGAQAGYCFSYLRIIIFGVKKSILKLNKFKIIIARFRVFLIVVIFASNLLTPVEFKVFVSTAAH